MALSSEKPCSVPAAAHELVLYTRRGCHLCEVAKAALLRVQGKHPFTLVEVDIDSDPDLKSDYGQLIPVVELAGRNVATYHVDEAALLSLLEQSP